VKAVILVGGLGTRLRPLTFSIPKPLLPVGERPVLQIVLEQLASFGIEDIVLATGYQAELIHAFCGDGSRFGVSIDYVHEDEPRGTAGPLALVKGRVEPDEYFVMMNGDVLAKMDFGRLLEDTRERGFDLTTCYTTYTYESPFGVLSISDGCVESITEKPRVDYAISAGIYAVNARALDLVPDDGYFTMPELMTSLIASERPVGAFHVDGFWIGLETIALFDEAIRELDERSGEFLADR
jgi:NDP-sugar pyrophosphorylase family protein